MCFNFDDKNIQKAKADLSADQSISLTSNTNDYTIENDYYKAIIPKASNPTNQARGIVKHLYVKKANGDWSTDLIYQGMTVYGLGYLEGSGSANVNRSSGMQNTADMTVTVVVNSSTEIQLQSSWTTYSDANYSELWTFWAKKSYFQGGATITAKTTQLTNELQMAWMVNDSLTPTWSGTDKDGNIQSFIDRQMQPIHSPNLETFSHDGKTGTYPWINWQFGGDNNVSLGMVFTDVYDKYGTVGETGDMPFEYQLDFELGSGVLDNPVKNGYKREINVIYKTVNSATNDAIQDFASNSYAGASIASTVNPILQAAAAVSNAWMQNTGVSSSLVSSPYFLLRQNGQNTHDYGSLGYPSKRPQYETSIYGPLYKNQSAITTNLYDFQDQLTYSLNYSDDSETYNYGTISSATPTNSSPLTSLNNAALSSDASHSLAYSTDFSTWDDSDKLQISGTASGAIESASVKDIYMSLKYQEPLKKFEAETATPTSSITNVLSGTDNLWTNYNYGYDSGTTLICSDKQEHCPNLSIPVNVANGTYEVTAYVVQRIEGGSTYNYSTDNVTWNSINVIQGASNTIVGVPLGNKNIANGQFYIGDDGSATTGFAGTWVGWDYITLKKVVSTDASLQDLGSNVYDLRLPDDPIYGHVGMGIKVNSPTDVNISIKNNSELLVYLFKEDTAQILDTPFSYGFDVEVYPHAGWLTNVSEFNGLRVKDPVANKITYNKHQLYIPEKIHTGRTNTVYENGVIAYSADPYNSTTETSLTIIPNVGSVDVSNITWNTSGDYSKTWTEGTAVADLTNTVHAVGDIEAGKYYTVSVGGVLGANISGDNCVAGICKADSGGTVNFSYSGDYSDPRTFDVELDGTLPTGTITINEVITKDALISLILNATSAPSGIASMQFSNDGANWSGWEVYAGTKSWNLETDAGGTDTQGNRTVYTQFKNNNGIVSADATDTVIYDTSPTFGNLPGTTEQVDPSEGQSITTNPYIIQVKPESEVGIEKVEFLVDDALICTETVADANGVYSCSWDTAKYHGTIRIIAYDIYGATTTITREVTVDPSLYTTTLPQTGKL